VSLFFGNYTPIDSFFRILCDGDACPHDTQNIQFDLHGNTVAVNYTIQTIDDFTIEITGWQNSSCVNESEANFYQTHLHFLAPVECFSSLNFSIDISYESLETNRTGNLWISDQPPPSSFMIENRPEGDNLAILHFTFPSSSPSNSTALLTCLTDDCSPLVTSFDLASSTDLIVKTSSSNSTILSLSISTPIDDNLNPRCPSFTSTYTIISGVNCARTTPNITSIRMIFTDHFTHESEIFTQSSGSGSGSNVNTFIRGSGHELGTIVIDELRISPALAEVRFSCSNCVPPYFHGPLVNDDQWNSLTEYSRFSINAIPFVDQQLDINITSPDCNGGGIQTFTYHFQVACAFLPTLIATTATVHPTTFTYISSTNIETDLTLTTDYSIHGRRTSYTILRPADTPQGSLRIFIGELQGNYSSATIRCSTCSPNFEQTNVSSSTNVTVTGLTDGMDTIEVTVESGVCLDSTKYTFNIIATDCDMTSPALVAHPMLIYQPRISPFSSSSIRPPPFGIEIGSSFSPTTFTYSASASVADVRDGTWTVKVGSYQPTSIQLGNVDILINDQCGTQLKLDFDTPFTGSLIQHYSGMDYSTTLPRYHPIFDGRSGVLEFRSAERNAINLIKTYDWDSEILNDDFTIDCSIQLINTSFYFSRLFEFRYFQPIFDSSLNLVLNGSNVPFEVFAQYDSTSGVDSIDGPHSPGLNSGEWYRITLKVHYEAKNQIEQTSTFTWELFIDGVSTGTQTFSGKNFVEKKRNFAFIGDSADNIHDSSSEHRLDGNLSQSQFQSQSVQEIAIESFFVDCFPTDSSQSLSRIEPFVGSLILR